MINTLKGCEGGGELSITMLDTPQIIYKFIFLNIQGYEGWNQNATHTDPCVDLSLFWDHPF